MSTPGWAQGASGFIAAQYDRAGYRSVPAGPVTLYGTAYGLLASYYLGGRAEIPDAVRRFVIDCQDDETGYFIGPELRDWTPATGSSHDREHLLLHLACAVLPAMQQFGIEVLHPLKFAHRFCDQSYLAEWLERRDMKNAWLEGNNLLFVGQLLVYLRDIEAHKGAREALEQWFRWLDGCVDPATGLWGTRDGASSFVAMCGGYHQLLVYYHEARPIQSFERLVDTVLGLQHPDGGFSPKGGGGACEDVDAVDILVNAYKLLDYRRPDIRAALRRTAASILQLQNRDGGFPYKRGTVQSHMGIPATRAGINVSTMFATWFRVHTLALIGEILTDAAYLKIPFRFSRYLSMGWHEPWRREEHPVGASARAQELVPTLKLRLHRVKPWVRRRIPF